MTAWVREHQLADPDLEHVAYVEDGPTWSYVETSALGYIGAHKMSNPPEIARI